MAKATATVAKPSAPVPVAKPGGRTGANLMQQYEAAINRGVGQGTEGNPLGDFRAGADAFWEQSANLRSYGDRLRGETRGHEKTLQGDQLKSQERQTNTQSRSQQSIARTGAAADNFAAGKNLEGIRVQTDGRIREAGIGAKAQVDVEGLRTGAQRYVSDNDTRVSLAGQGSAERMARMTIDGDNYRSQLSLAGSLLTNKADNETQRQGKFFDYMGNVANAQWRAPDVNNIKYWGG